MRTFQDRFLSLCPAVAPGLALLWKAYCYADELGCDPREFAIDLDALHAGGLDNNALRWLLHKGYVTSAKEVKLSRGGQDAGHCADLVLPARTGFTLTPSGARFLQDLRLDRSPARTSADDGPAKGPGAESVHGATPACEPSS
jgi:hypothetical protein